MRVVSYNSEGVFCIDGRSEWTILEAATGKVEHIPKRGFPTYDMALVQSWGYTQCDVHVASLVALSSAFMRGGIDRWARVLENREQLHIMK